MSLSFVSTAPLAMCINLVQQFLCQSAPSSDSPHTLVTFFGDLGLWLLSWLRCLNYWLNLGCTCASLCLGHGWDKTVKKMIFAGNLDVRTHTRLNRHFRYLNWRYCTIQGSILWGPLHSLYVGVIYGRYLPFRSLKWSFRETDAPNLGRSRSCYGNMFCIPCSGLSFDGYPTRILSLVGFISSITLVGQYGFWVSHIFMVESQFVDG